jgi:hypothetical protein
MVWAFSTLLAILLTFRRSIVHYEPAEARILLEHAYPRDANPIPRIHVEVSLVLENIKSTTLAAGTWINVIGYTLAIPRSTHKSREDRLRLADQSVRLQAVLIWDAGAVRIGDYERMLEEQRLVQRYWKSTCN